MARVVPWFIHQIFNDEPITVFGPEKVLDFTYVDDCVAALMSGIERLGDGRIKNETVNVASGVGHSLQELAGYVASFAGKEPQVVLAPARTGEIIRYVGNLEKARVLLGFHPKTTLQDGIRHAIAWTKEWSRARVRVRRSVIPRGANSV
jgi:UDP-glucose 4-epimerase